MIRELTTLEDLTLRSTTVPDLDFLAELDRLWSLDIKLGGTTNLAALSGMRGIKYLELWQVRGLAPTPGIVAELPGLQHLFLQSLPQVTALPDLASLQHLRRLVLQNMKGLDDLTAVGTAPALEEFAFIEASGKEPDIVLPVLPEPVESSGSAPDSGATGRTASSSDSSTTTGSGHSAASSRSSIDDKPRDHHADRSTRAPLDGSDEEAQASLIALGCQGIGPLLLRHPRT